MKGNRFTLFGTLLQLSTFAFFLATAEMPASLSEAEELFQATLYSKAIPLFQQILEELNTNEQLVSAETARLADHLNCRLGQAHFYTNNYKEAAKHLLQIHNSSPEQPTFILAQTFRHLDQPQKAIEHLKEFLTKNPGFISNDLEYELALNYFLLGKLSEAKSTFAKIIDSGPKDDLNILSNLYLSRIHLSEHSYKDAKKQLESLSQSIPSDNLLRYELAYLQGETAFNLQNYQEAIQFFENALPVRNEKNAKWYPETLYYLGWSLLKDVDQRSSENEQVRYFKKAENYFTRLLELQPEERVYLALAQCHLMQANILKDKKAYAKAQKILSQTDKFQTLDAKTHALLLLAESASSYQKRKKYYEELTQEANKSSPFYAKGWYLKGLNDYEEGYFHDAAEALYHAHMLLEAEDPSCSALALKYAIEACYRQDTQESLLQGFSFATNFLKMESLLNSVSDPQEVYYLAGMIACKLSEENKEFVSSVKKFLDEGIQKYPKGHFSDKCMHLLASSYFRQKEISKAEELYTQLLKDYPNSLLVPEALYWLSECTETLKKDVSIAKNYRQQLFENYPESTLAPAAYFHYYSYRDYLQGDRAALKHLQSFQKKFSDHPLQINALYLLGLDYKRDRKSPEGKFISKKNLTEAIEAFYQAETLFELLNNEQKIPKDQIAHYTLLKNRASLERALANQAIAEESLSTKRKIYAQYAKELFLQLNQELAISETNFPKLQEEALYLLAQHDIKFDDDVSALRTIETAIKKYQDFGISEGYYLSRMSYEKGKVAMRQDDHELALDAFGNAENYGKSSNLSVDQKLDLWIQQSLCYKALNDTDQAMLILSKVINDNTISSLRIKAMYLRADIYAIQGRYELARKQLEATAKKGGEWALKAKTKLDTEYAY